MPTIIQEIPIQDITTKPPGTTTAPIIHDRRTAPEITVPTIDDRTIVPDITIVPDRTTVHDKTFFEHAFVKLFSDYIETKALESRLTDLRNAPKIVDHENILKIQLRDGSSFEINPVYLDKDCIIEGLCILYGFGMLRPDYNLEIFKELNSSELTIAKCLADEIWDRRGHLDFMLNYRGHTCHDESKDLEFCRLLAEGKISQAIDRHTKACLEARDTPHHIRLAEFGNYLMQKHPLLKEMFDDQASIAGRYFRKRARRMQAHSDYQTEILGKGVLLKGENGSVCFWNPQVFDTFINDDNCQQQIWREWKESNIAFCRYWTSRFGAMNEYWAPPGS